MAGPRDKRPGASPVPANYAAPVVGQLAGTSPAMTDRFIRSNDTLVSSRAVTRMGRRPDRSRRAENLATVSATEALVLHELAPDVRAQTIRPMPDLPPALDATVELLWQQAAARMARGRAGRLFNGRVFSADAITPTLITGHLTEYRRVVAQFEQPALFAELGLRPLAVCGVLRCADGVVFGRRHVDAIYQAGMWQLPPAGSVDASAMGHAGMADLGHQIRVELREELGLPPEAIGPPRPLCLVEHPGTHVSDLGLALVTPETGGAVQAAHRRSGNGEYAPLRVVPLAQVADFVAVLGDTLVPSARVFLARAGLLPAEAAGGQAGG